MVGIEDSLDPRLLTIGLLGCGPVGTGTHWGLGLSAFDGGDDASGSEDDQVVELVILFVDGDD